MARDTTDRFVWADVETDECPTLTDAKIKVRTNISLRRFDAIEDSVTSLIDFLQLVIVDWHGFDGLSLPDGIGDLTFGETKYLTGLAVRSIRDPQKATSAATC